MTYFPDLNGFKTNFSYFTKNLPLDYSEIFNIFRITVCVIFYEFRKV